MNRLDLVPIFAGTIIATSMWFTGIIGAANSAPFPAGELAAVSLSPAPHVNNAAAGATIEISFDRPVNDLKRFPHAFLFDFPGIQAQ